MNDNPTRLRPPAATRGQGAAALAPGRAWWQAQTPRDRRLLLLAAAVLLAYFTWAVLLQPALHGLRLAASESERLQAQMQTMQRLATEAQQLRAQPPVSVVQSGAALQAATQRLGDSGRLALQGDRAVLTLNGASPAQLRDWLSEARSGARARPVEAQLARADTGYSGTLVVAFGEGL
jgi:general secretion pathway protein M